MKSRPACAYLSTFQPSWPIGARNSTLRTDSQAMVLMRVKTLKTVWSCALSVQMDWCLSCVFTTPRAPTAWAYRWCSARVAAVEIVLWVKPGLGSSILFRSRCCNEVGNSPDHSQDRRGFSSADRISPRSLSMHLRLSTELSPLAIRSGGVWCHANVPGARCSGCAVHQSFPG